MKARELSNALRLRVVVAVMLAACSVVLLMANRVAEKVERKSVLRETEVRPLLQEINHIIDTLLDRYRVNPKWVASWGVFSRDRRFIREERRVYVPPRFISLDFNHDLSRELAKYDARVVATERTKELSVSMHIILKGMIVESITFVLKRDLS